MQIAITALCILFAAAAWALDPTLGSGSLSAPGQCLTLTTRGLRVALSRTPRGVDFDPRVARALLRRRHLFACVVPRGDGFEVSGALLSGSGQVVATLTAPFSGADCVVLYLRRPLYLCAP